VTGASGGVAAEGSPADQLPELLADADLPAPIDHQRRLAASLDALIDAGRSPMLATAAGTWPVLDLVRTETFLYASRVALWQDLLEALPPTTLQGLGLPVTPELVAADRLVCRADPARTPLVTPSRARQARVRQAAYRLRVQIDRIRAERAVRAGALGAPDLILVPWRAAHVARWRPVVERLSTDDGWGATVLASDGRAVAAATGAALDAVRVGWGSGAPLADVRIRRSLQRLGHDVEGPLAAALGAVPGPALAPLRATADAVGARVDPAAPPVVVVPNPYIGEGRIAARVAQDGGAPVVSAQHGTIFPDDPRWQRCPVDRLCLWGPAASDALVGSGLAADQLVVTGVLTGQRPARDTSPPTSTPGSPADPATVLVATSGAGDRVSLAQHLVFLGWLVEAIAARPQLRWVVKLHPKDDPALYARVASTGARVVEAGPRTPPIDDFLDEAAVLVTVASATALDAARRQVPVVLVAVPGSTDHVDVPVLAEVAAGVATDAVTLAAFVDQVSIEAVPASPPHAPASWRADVDDPVAAVCAVVRDVSRRS
jgi:hypothetical protein